jgi:SAM-dependent methyltransferase
VVNAKAGAFMRVDTPRFISGFLETHMHFNRVLEVGSKDINGNIRELFTDSEYIGIDMEEGNNVDLVLNGHNLVEHFGELSFDLVVCLDTLEHDDGFWLTVQQMKKVLKNYGYLVIAVPSINCEPHFYPDDYWRFLESGVKAMFEDMDDFYIESKKYVNSQFVDEIYAWGRKR